MPIEVTYTDEGSGVVMRGTGFLSNDEYLDALMKHLRRDIAITRELRYSFSDYSEIDGVDISVDTIETVAAECIELAKYNTELVVAVVGTRDLYYGLLRMWESMSDNTGWETLVSRDREEAREWIRNEIARKHGIRDISFS